MKGARNLWAWTLLTPPLLVALVLFVIPLLYLPALALGRRGDRLYARFLRRMLPLWRRFNEFPARWHETWGIAYRIHGLKPAGESLLLKGVHENRN